MIKASELLKDARDLICSPEHFCRGALAVDLDGHPVDPESPEAEAWCSIGALRKMTKDNGTLFEAEEALNIVLQKKGWMDGIAGWNDTHPHRCVIALFNDAIRQSQE